jgi:hypothetical protein
MAEDHIDKRSEKQFTSPYEPGSERDQRWRFTRGDETATPKHKDGTPYTKSSGFWNSHKPEDDEDGDNVRA